MDTADPGHADPVTDGASALQLVRAGAVLRWSRPDLTATLAELALDAATDAVTWVTAAGWLLHGRAALGDGRETACELLEGLGRWGDEGVALVAGGPAGRRLRAELAGAARRIGEPGVARALLTADEAFGDDAELRADVLTELARCAVDDDQETADGALQVAEQAWRRAGSPAGVASVLLLSAARHRQRGRTDEAVTQALDGLRHVNAGGRRAGATAADHVAAALTAEWIAALTEAGRLDEAHTEALPAAHRLIGAARTGRQTAGLRLALARVTAVGESPEAVLTALEAAAQDAADSDVPELESACRSMLGELHEDAGRLDVALGALRAAIAAERRDRERGSRLRARLTAAVTTWAAGSSSHPYRRPGATTADRADLATAFSFARTSGSVPHADAVTRSAPERPGTTTGARPDDPHAEGVPGRRARRLAAEASAGGGDHDRALGGHLRDPGLPGLGHPVLGQPVLGQPVLGQPVLGQPVLGQPVLGQPVLGQPVLGQPDLDHPAPGRPRPLVDDLRDPVHATDGHHRAGAARGTTFGATLADGARGHGDTHPPEHPLAPDTSATFRLASSARVERLLDTWGGADGSLIGDALLREFADGAASADGASARTTHAADATQPAGGDDALDPRTASRDAPSGRIDRATAVEDTVVIAVTRESGVLDRRGAPGHGDDRASGPRDVPDRPRDPNGRGRTGAAGEAANGHAGRPADGDATRAEARPAHRASARGARPPSTDADGLGLAELLAGALAAYRNL